MLVLFLGECWLCNRFLQVEWLKSTHTRSLQTVGEGQEFQWSQWGWGQEDKQVKSHKFHYIIPLQTTQQYNIVWDKSHLYKWQEVRGKVVCRSAFMQTRKSENSMYSISWKRHFTVITSDRTCCFRWGLTDQISIRPLSILIHFWVFCSPSCSTGASDQHLTNLERISNHGDLICVCTLQGQRGIQILCFFSKWVLCHTAKLGKSLTK